MNENKETSIQVLKYVREANGYHPTICPHVAHTRPDRALPAIGSTGCKNCIFHEAQDREQKTVDCSCTAHDLDPSAIDHMQPELPKEFGGAGTGNPIEGLLEMLSGGHKQKSSPMDALAEMMVSMREEGAMPELKMSAEEIQEKSAHAADVVWNSLQKGMGFLGKMIGKETLKIHETQVYDLLEEKIAARRKELELL